MNIWLFLGSILEFEPRRHGEREEHRGKQALNGAFDSGLREKKGFIKRDTDRL